MEITVVTDDLDGYEDWKERLAVKTWSHADRTRAAGHRLLLIDLRSHTRALAAIHASLSSHPPSLVLAVDHQGSSAARVDLLEAGAGDCVSRPVLDEEVVLRVRRLLRLQRHRGTSVEYGDVFIDRDAERARRGTRDLGLTPRELALLTVMIANAEVVMSRRELHERAWGYDYDYGSNALSVYVRYLRRKLTAGGERQLIHTVRAAGYVLSDRGPAHGTP